MKRSHFYLLMSAIYLAPITNVWLAIGFASVWLLLAAASLWEGD